MLKSKQKWLISILVTLTSSMSLQSIRAQDSERRMSISCNSGTSCMDASVPKPFRISNYGNIKEEIVAIQLNACRLVPWGTSVGSGYRQKLEIDFLPANAGIDLSNPSVRRLKKVDMQPDDYQFFWNRPEWDCGPPRRFIVETTNGDFNINFR